MLILNAAFGRQVPFYPVGAVNPSVPSPSSILGYEIGDRFTDYRNLERYMERLSASSNRVKRIIYGETYEHRPLQLLVIGSPTNLAKMEEIRSSNLKLTDPRMVKLVEAGQIIEKNPVIVWLSYGVHGNESSSPEAAIATAYQLCAGTDARTQSILENVIVIIDPSQNPDGRERYVRWVNSAASISPNSDPETYEHREPWPGGRTNHYYFDLNRDWAWQTQQETQHRIKIYRDWMPQVHVDFHEMGFNSSYFFFPAAPPFHEALPPEIRKWGEIFGKGNAEAFDKLGIPYFVGEVFDMFHPGYGDSWPTFNGAIGMTYEQAGGAGRSIQKANGNILTLRDRARNHFLTGIATLETAMKNRRERLQDFYKFWQTGIESSGRLKGYVIPEGREPGRAAELISLLLKQGIEVHQIQEAVQFDAQPFYTKRSSRELFPKGTFVVSLQQPQSRLARALIEPQASVKDTFFYDVSAWSLPVAFGLNAYTTEAPLPSSAKLIVEPGRKSGSVIGGRAQFAYLIPMDQGESYKLVRNLLEKSYTLHFATRRFEIGHMAFQPGTVVVFVSQNSDSLHTDIQRLSSHHALDVYSTNTGLSEKGISLGSNRVRPLKKSRIAILTDSPVSANDYGELWYLFERVYEIPFTALRVTDIRRVDLQKYDVIIIPNSGDLRSTIDSTSIDQLKRWVQQGGSLIGIEEGARFLTKNRSGLTSAILQTEKRDDDKTKEEKDQEKAKRELSKKQTLFEKEESSRLSTIAGAIFRAVIDTTHPIGFSMPPQVYVFKRNGIPIELTDAGHTVASFSKDTTEVSGYAFPERAKRTAETSYIQDFRSGKGHIVLFAEDVSFRMFWLGLNRMLMNAVMYLPEP